MSFHFPNVGLPRSPNLQEYHFFPPTFSQTSQTASEPSPRLPPATTDDDDDDEHDILVQRFQDLALRLAGTPRLDRPTIAALHAQADALEQALEKKRRAHDPHASGRGLQGLGIAAALDEEAYEENGWGSRSEDESSQDDDDEEAAVDDGVGSSLAHPPTATPIQKPAPPTTTVLPVPAPPAATSSKPSALTPATDALDPLSHLTTTIASLRTRHAEVVHIHDITIVKAERAAQQILALEAHVAALEADLADVRADHERHRDEWGAQSRRWGERLVGLKVGLKTLEVQAGRWIAVDGEGGDEDGEARRLREGIKRWKEEWRVMDEEKKTEGW